MGHRLINLVLVPFVCLPVGLIAQTYEGEIGDVNNDTTVNVLDAVKTVNFILGTETPDSVAFWRADCNSSWFGCQGDGMIDILDVEKIIDIILDLVECSKIEMVSVEGGTFQMGSSDGSSDEQPIHQVTLSSFSTTKYEITNAQYCEFLNATGVSSTGHVGDTLYINLASSFCQIDYTHGQFTSKKGMENYPVIFVTWYGARAFCVWVGGRLLTEAEWEYAARGGQHTHGYKCSGSNDIDEVGWYCLNSTNPDNPIREGKGTHRVGQKMPNELDIYDMSGNVAEWCHDWYGSYYYYPQTNPKGPSHGSYRLARGGSYVSCANYYHVTRRFCRYPSSGYDFIGFRLCKE